MKKSGILNRDIAAVLARLGHTDTVIIADCGLPIPEDTRCIDVSLTIGTPSFTSVLKAVTTDMELEKMTLANEMKDTNQSLHNETKGQYNNIPITYIPHQELKSKLKEAKAIIRTGEATPYANVILHAGVIF
ncbi:D-ribose pyranase [Virgibacillus halotolerans]|uniref:D-ribose pyranase n=1 Tax=Virgibacillus halotolerans TaxID=1071053 RepID=UPI0019616E91|nr:D-ribose pyranase [Virgibacillus halotolerans]MBM7600323.1 D-ribose pyranase [Virgibacillus halotolerans]